MKLPRELSGCVALYDAVTAEEFIRHIEPRGALTGEGGPGRWLFRGHASSEWSLSPSAFRRGGVGSRITEYDQARQEANSLLEFFEIADSVGLPLPEDSQLSRRLLRMAARGGDDHKEKMRSGAIQWPPEELLSLLALAQHHGIATRLLDWTYSPFTASYFAACDALQHYVSEKFAVWAIDSRVFDVDARARKTEPELLRVTAPSAGNPNLMAQRGAFTLYRPAQVDPDAQPRDSLGLERLLPEALGWAGEMTLLHKVTLPAQRAGQLLRLLALEGIEASVLFPGYDGVTRAMRERRRWEE